MLATLNAYGIYVCLWRKRYVQKPSNRIAQKTVFKARFKPVSDQDYLQYRNRCYPIKEQWSTFERRRSYEATDHIGDHMNLAAYYSALRFVFGLPSAMFDDWKSAFAYSFLVEVFQDQEAVLYLFRLVNWRSTVELRFNKVLEEPEKYSDLSVYREPLDDEFSEAEMQIFDNFLYGFLQGITKNLPIPTPDFQRRIESNLIVFDYRDGLYYERYFEEPDEYQSVIDQWQHDDEGWPDFGADNWIDIKIERGG